MPGQQYFTPPELIGCGLRFYETPANGSNYVELRAPVSIGADKVWTLPATDGSSGHVLKTNGAGALNFGAVAWSEITGKPSAFTPEGHDILLYHTASGLTPGTFLKAATASTLAFGAVAWSEISGKPSAFTPDSHDMISSHTASGLTAGHVLRATGTATFAFAALQAGDIPNLDAAKITGGILSQERGGLGSSINAYARYSMIYQDVSGGVAAVSPNVTNTPMFLRMTGTGSAGVAPSWNQVGWSDIASKPSSFTPTSHVLATTSGLGAEHSVSGLTAGQVLRATSATTAAFGALQASDIPTISGDKVQNGSMLFVGPPETSLIRTDTATGLILPMFRITYGGSLSWGMGGGTATDVGLSRSGVGVLNISGLLTLSGNHVPAATGNKVAGSPTVDGYVPVTINGVALKLATVA